MPSLEDNSLTLHWKKKSTLDKSDSFRPTFSDSEVTKQRFLYLQRLCKCTVLLLDPIMKKCQGISSSRANNNNQDNNSDDNDNDSSYKELLSAALDSDGELILDICSIFKSTCANFRMELLANIAEIEKLNFFQGLIFFFFFFFFFF
ncbi:hypothetical protein RFI_27967 [Reticulomyxa filosa]|uniref:Uncharacterized protein n=1 Tax=Reticulomyxa filosa TaxID=46433 RepID=X6M7I9_RETFI|nr:hypothetical protein RFI_27967 [Reticulomyxa filosa]|eukprot:ETO09407.1 hypothetical protein RFI_27967 [Reticulomyxa filosa]